MFITSKMSSLTNKMSSLTSKMLSLTSKMSSLTNKMLLSHILTILQNVNYKIVRAQDRLTFVPV